VISAAQAHGPPPFVTRQQQVLAGLRGLADGLGSSTVGEGMNQL